MSTMGRLEKELDSQLKEHRKVLDKALLKGQYQFQLQLVAFDKKGVPHKFATLPTSKLVRSEWMPVLVLLGSKGDEVEWYGPLWFEDPDRNGKKRYLDHLDLVRMGWYSTEDSHPRPTVAMDASELGGGEEVRYYLTQGGKRCKVPTLYLQGKLQTLTTIGFR